VVDRQHRDDVGRGTVGHRNPAVVEDDLRHAEQLQAQRRRARTLGHVAARPHRAGWALLGDRAQLPDADRAHEREVGAGARGTVRLDHRGVGRHQHDEALAAIDAAELAAHVVPVHVGQAHVDEAQRGLRRGEGDDARATGGRGLGAPADLLKRGCVVIAVGELVVDHERHVRARHRRR
jgi:hypothetical protein